MQKEKKAKIETKESIETYYIPLITLKCSKCKKELGQYQKPKVGNPEIYFIDECKHFKLLIFNAVEHVVYDGEVACIWLPKQKGEKRK